MNQAHELARLSGFSAASYCAVPHAGAVCSATAGLRLACRVLDLGPGDRLWTSPNTCVLAILQSALGV